MTCEKAHELFSELHESTLDPGLLQAVEQHLSACPACEHTFSFFQKTYAATGELPPAPVPSDLSERISRRLDRALWDRKQAQKRIRPSWLRLGAYGAAAAAVILVAYTTAGPYASKAVPAGPGLFGGGQAEAEVVLVGKEARIQFKPVRATTISVYEGGSDFRVLPPADAELRRTNDLRPLQGYNVPLARNSANAVTLWVVVKGERTVSAVILPGDTEGVPRAEGNIISALRAVSRDHNQVIHIRLQGLPSLKAESAVGDSLEDSLESVLSGTGLRWMLRDGVVVIR